MRDDGLENGLWDGWKNQLISWKVHVTNQDYKVGMYLVYEHLMDAERGPAAIERLSELMQTAGFPIAPKKDMGCLWYQSVGGKVALEHHYKYGYHFDEYVPGYTKKQQAYLLREISNLIEQQSSDVELVNVLREFQHSIRDGLPYDKAWENQTETQH